MDDRSPPAGETGREPGPLERRRRRSDRPQPHVETHSREGSRGSKSKEYTVASRTMPPGDARPAPAPVPGLETPVGTFPRRASAGPPDRMRATAPARARRSHARRRPGDSSVAGEKHPVVAPAGDKVRSARRLGECTGIHRTVPSRDDRPVGAVVVGDRQQRAPPGSRQRRPDLSRGSDVRPERRYHVTGKLISRPRRLPRAAAVVRTVHVSARRSRRTPRLSRTDRWRWPSRRRRAPELEPNRPCTAAPSEQAKEEEKATDLLTILTGLAAGHTVRRSARCAGPRSGGIPAPALLFSGRCLAFERPVFPAAGLGTRFLPATKAQPKEMLPLVDKPLIQYAVEEARIRGSTRSSS